MSERMESLVAVVPAEGEIGWTGTLARAVAATPLFYVTAPSGGVPWGGPAGKRTFCSLSLLQL